MANSRMPVPLDFADDRRHAFHAKVATKYQTSASDVWQQFSGALGGLLYRITACAEHDEKFTASVTWHGPAPPEPHRYGQERELYEFFVTGQSAIECLCYALYSLGAMAQPSAFNLFTKGKPQAITPESTSEAYNDRYAGHHVTTAVSDLIGAPEYKRWKYYRNILTHRMHPGRLLSINHSGSKSNWLDFPIDSNTTNSRRKWLVERINQLLKEAEAFVDGLP